MVDFQTQIVPQLRDHHHGGLCSTTAISEYDCGSTGELGYDGPLYDGSLHMMDDMLGPSLMHI